MEKEAEERFGAERNCSFGLPLCFLNHGSDIAEGKFICLSLWYLEK